MTHQQVLPPILDLLRGPDGSRDRQLLCGDTVEILSTADGWSHIRADKDGYIGYVPANSLVSVQAATHWVNTLATHAYTNADMKSPDRLSLSFGARVAALTETPTFIETQHGFIPKQHLADINTRCEDPITIAEQFLDTPYLWGGNSRLGLDCSGLVQAALLACGHDCPGDSGDQEREVGRLLDPGTLPKRGDLLFWKGHVAWVVDANTLLHANAFHMAVRYEPLKPAIERIKAQGDGPVTAHKRL